jgi:hypothetical protein
MNISLQERTHLRTLHFILTDIQVGVGPLSFYKYVKTTQKQILSLGVIGTLRNTKLGAVMHSPIISFVVD